MMSQLQPKSQHERAVLRQVAEYLFGRPKSGEEDFLDMRTDIDNKSTFQALTYYRVLDTQFNCKAAKSVASLLERLLISGPRRGRTEAVQALLQQNQDKENVLIRGIEESLKKATKNIEKSEK